MIARPQYTQFRKTICTGDFIVHVLDWNRVHKVQHVDHSSGLLTVGLVNADGSWFIQTLPDGRRFPLTGNVVTPHGWHRIADSEVAERVAVSR